MDRTSFYDRPEKASKEVFKKLRAAIVNDARPSGKDSELIKLRFFQRYTICILNLVQCQTGFAEMYKSAIIDLDMKDDLERSNVINWCRTAKSIQPLKTTGDGNCLLHAVSLALWGIEDSDQFLRRLLYLNITTDSKGMFKRRWLAFQRHFTQTQRLEIRMNTEEYGTEWETVIKATEDVMNQGNHGLPYTTLESIHLYVLANILCRPIIVLADRIARNVYGQSLQESEIGGIYLPLESTPSECHKNPIIIGYNMNHFAPLVFEESDFSMSDNMQVVPLVSNELNSLTVHYLLGGEESRAQTLLMEYLVVKEVVYTGSDGPLAIPSVQVTHEPLPRDMNVMEAYRKDCESLYLKLTGINVQQNRQPFNVQQNRQPFNFRQRATTTQNTAGATVNIMPHNAVNIFGGEVVIVPSTHGAPKKIARTFQVVPSDQKKCIHMGCKYNGSPETGGYCSKCFARGTVQFHKQEEKLRKAKQTRPAPEHVAGNQFGLNNGFHDVSIMGEDCNAGCGFKCSTETFPYCHECYPKFSNNVQPQDIPTATPNPPLAPANHGQEGVQLSILPDNCINEGCTFRSSVATQPYCHQCFDEVAQLHRNADPTAPPPSIPAEGTSGENHLHNLSQQSGITPQESSRQLNDITSPPQMVYTPMETEEQGHGWQGMLPRKCKMVECENQAIRGNDGMCETCYNASMFGPGIGVSPPPADQNLVRVIQQIEDRVCSSPGCTENAKSGLNQCVACFLENGELSSARQLSGQMAMNIMVPTDDEKILNSQENLNPLAPGFSVAVTNPPGQGVEVPAAVRLQTERQAEYGQKLSCATPGCKGTHLDNEFGLCSTCYDKVCAKSDLEISYSPVELTEQELKKLNPVVVSSRQKTECASPFCKEMIYPPKAYCEDCFSALQESCAKKSVEENKLSATDKPQNCKTSGCKFFGRPELSGFCSQCFKGKGPEQAPTRMNSAPIIQHKNRLLNGQATALKNNTSPLPLHAGRYSHKLCVVEGCQRYADPKQYNRCSQHYKEATSPVPPKMYGMVENQVGQTVSLHHRQVARPLPQGGAGGGASAEPDPFIQSFSKVEGNLKARNLCKNNLTKGCQNFGNSQKLGYCNSCYPEIRQQQRVQQMAIAGGNWFG